MTKDTYSLLNNVSMIYSKKQLVEMFEAERERRGLSKRAYAKELDIDYDRVLSWFRPERERGTISYSDATKIVDGCKVLTKPDNVEEDPEPSTVAEVSKRVTMLEQLFIRLIDEVAVRTADPVIPASTQKDSN